MLEHAVARLGSVVVRADALALPIASGRVDNVLFVAALHAIGDVRGAVAEAARVLRPGGRLLAAHDPPRRDPDDDDVARAVAPVTGLQGARPDSVAALDAAAAAAALRPVGADWLAPAVLSYTPNSVADSIDQRLWSYLWSVDQPTWDSVVTPAVAALRRTTGAGPPPREPRRHAPGRLRAAGGIARHRGTGDNDQSVFPCAKLTAEFG
jgi:SAM-dependent methyltransferase